MSSYMLWLHQNRAQLNDLYKKSLDPDNAAYRSSKFVEFAGMCWSELNDQQREPYVQQANEARTQYNEAIREQRERQPAGQAATALGACKTSNIVELSLAETTSVAPQQLGYCTMGHCMNSECWVSQSEMS